MKIAIVQGAFYPVPTRRGGAVEKIWFALGQEFARRGHEVTHYSRLCDDLPPAETIAGVRHIRIQGADTPVSRLRQKWRDLCYTWRVARRLQRADVVVTHTFFSPFLLSRRRHGPLWVHVQRYPQGQFRFYRRADRFQTVSRVIARALVAEVPTALSRVRIIRNPLPTLLPATPLALSASSTTSVTSAPTPTSVPAPTHPPRDPNLVLFVGRLHPEKGVELLLRAAILATRQAPALRFRIVGPAETRFGGGGETWQHDLAERATVAGARVEFTGPVFDEALLAAHYRAASVFVYPSLADRGEASPVAPLEALAHGCPIVTSDLACFDDTVGHGPHASRFDHLAPDAPARLLAALVAVLDARRQWPAASAAAVARAQEFSLDRIAEEYLAGFAALHLARS